MDDVLSIPARSALIPHVAHGVELVPRDAGGLLLAALIIASAVVPLLALAYAAVAVIRSRQRANRSDITRR